MYCSNVVREYPRDKFGVVDRVVEIFVVGRVVEKLVVSRFVVERFVVKLSGSTEFSRDKSRSE